jgi:uncharacterized protein YjbI with pentapeptide repeats
MANQEHLDILKQGVEVWNAWRKEHPEVQPDLRGSYLRSANLRSVNLSGADLRSADLSNAYPSRTNLSGANLSGAKLGNINLSQTNLSNVNLSGADLWNVNLSGADLKNVNLSNASTGRTIFGDLDLRIVKGLETVKHNGPSTIGADTILRSEGNIPESFLRGAGLDETFISYVLALAKKPIQYYTCFISYSSKDQEFAERLYADLQNNNVRCWYASEDLKIGDKFRVRIDESIRLYDKLLLVLSEHSLASNWVAYEVEKALNKEPEGTPNVLFPIRLDKTILTCETDWAKDIQKSRHIGDFEHWKDHDAYQQAFQRLLRDLKAQS